MPQPVISLEFVENVCRSSGVDPVLVLAMAEVESGRDPYAVRFEPRWKYWERPEVFAKQLGITVQTEKTLQAMSWGLLQVMGAVCRELDYGDHLTKLIDPVLNIRIAAAKLKQLHTRWQTLGEVISAYNQGSPVLGNDGRFQNQDYVDKVLRTYYRIMADHY